jgi:hypothetical protein
MTVTVVQGMTVTVQLDTARLPAACAEHLGMQLDID